ncbi:MAG: hypothetical protein ACRELA_17565, partial [Candidatus Rokuibacteriota bacterium]
MSGKNRVNPDHYKVAGRGAQGEAIVPDLEKRKYARDRRGPDGPDALPGPRATRGSKGTVTGEARVPGGSRRDGKPSRSA